MKVREIQQFYSNPKLIPTKIKKKLSLSVEEKRSKIESIINDPHDIFTAKKISKWTAMQVVKLFFGLPVIPGRQVLMKKKTFYFEDYDETEFSVDKKSNIVKISMNRVTFLSLFSLV